MKHQNRKVAFASLALLLLCFFVSGVSPQKISANAQTAISPSNSSTLDDWSMYRHDLNNTATSNSTAPVCNLLWQFNGYPDSPDPINRLRTTAAVANGVVYVGTETHIFCAFDAYNGSLIWQFDSVSNPESSAAVVGNVIYLGILWDGSHGYVDALSATNGSVIWRFPTDSGVESSPTVFNGVVYVGSYLGYVYALNATNGALIWSYLTGASCFSSPAVVTGVLYIGAESGNFYALNITNGSLLWLFNAQDRLDSSPTVVDGVVYFVSDNGTVHALRANGGSEIWKANIGVGTDHTGVSPAVANGIVYVGSRNGYYALNATDGSQIWFFTSPYSRRQLTGYQYSSPAISGSVVYFGSCDGYLFALDAYNGSIIWSYQVGTYVFASPAIANGVVYIGSYDGNIYALGIPTTQTLPYANPNPTPKPTATPTPTATPQPTATPTTTPIPDPAVTPSQTLSPIVATQPGAKSVINVNPPQLDLIGWLILSFFIAVAVTGVSVIGVSAKKASLNPRWSLASAFDEKSFKTEVTKPK